MSKWLTVDLPYAYFYIEVKDGIVVKAAPIGRWMVGKTLFFVKMWVASKKGRVIE